MRHHKRYGGVKGEGTVMQAKAMAAHAERYARGEGAGVADGLLATLIDLFTVQGDAAPPAPDEVRAAWERLTRRLDAEIAQREQRQLQDGIALLADSLLEAGDALGAAAARGILLPAVSAPPSSATAAAPVEPVPSFAPDSPFWTPRPAL